MNQIAENIHQIKKSLANHDYTLVAVSKTKPNEAITSAYEGGQRHFGENKVQELVDKQAVLPKDITWHMIGHLQRNKVKYIAPFVYLIHGVDTEKLLVQINKEGKKINRKINCLLQVHIAKEDTKFGFSTTEINEMIEKGILQNLQFIEIKGLMGMATNTKDQEVVISEFSELNSFYKKLKPLLNLEILSMGMSGDYHLALEAGSNMVRIGSAIFGERDYAN